MDSGVLARWMFREGARSPATWTLLIGVGLLALALGLAGPLGILESGPVNGQYVASIWFLSAYIGALVGLMLLDRVGGLWDEIPERRQLWLGGLLILAASLVFACAGTSPLMALGRESLPLVGALLCLAHWSAQASFLQRSDLSLTGKCIALACLGWWIPALLESSTSSARLEWALSPERHLEPRTAATETSVGALVDTIPIVAWWVAAALLP